MKKKFLPIIIICILCLCVFGVIKSSNSPEPPDLAPYAIKWNDIIYFYFSKTSETIPDESNIVGTITTQCPEDELPQKNGESNLPIIGSKIAVLEEYILVYMNEKWYFFVTEEQKNALWGKY